MNLRSTGSRARRDVGGCMALRNVIARFPDMASAEAAYADPAYQAVLPTAHGAAERSLVLVEIDD